MLARFVLRDDGAANSLALAVRKRVQLPTLMRLTLYDVATPVHLLTYLDLPSNITIGVIGDGPQAISDVLPIGCPHLDDSLFTTLRAVGLGAKSNLYACGESSAIWISPHSVPGNDGADGVAKFRFGMLQIVQNVEHLWLDGSFVNLPEQWAMVASAVEEMQALQKIVFATSHRQDVYGLWLQALLCEKDQGYPCPSLCEIVFCQDRHPLDLETCKTLLYVATQRRKQCHPIRSVQLHLLAPQAALEVDVTLASLSGSEGELAKVIAELRIQLESGVQVFVADRLPSMEAPPVARSQSEGEWKWPVWPKDFLR